MILIVAIFYRTTNKAVLVKLKLKTINIQIQI